MRIYIIGNDGIRLSREAPAAVNDGEVAVASKEELHAAPLSGKRLLALWNALPGCRRCPTLTLCSRTKASLFWMISRHCWVKAQLELVGARTS